MRLNRTNRRQLGSCNAVLSTDLFIKSKFSEFGTYLEAASGAILHHNADVRRFDACADEAVEIVVRQFLHEVELLLDGSVDFDVTTSDDLDRHLLVLVLYDLESVDWVGIAGIHGVRAQQSERTAL